MFFCRYSYSATSSEAFYTFNILTTWKHSKVILLLMVGCELSFILRGVLSFWKGHLFH